MSDDLPFVADSIAAALAYAAMAEGNAPCVSALAVSIPRFAVTGFEDWHGNPMTWEEPNCTTLLTFYLEVPVVSFGQFYRLREDIQQHIFDMLKPIIASYHGYRAVAVCVVPGTTAPANWHGQALAWLRGEGVNNQGRVRSDNIATREHDGLLFRTDEEINLYRAFKAQGVTFAPLPVFIQGETVTSVSNPTLLLSKAGWWH
jgi:hypothetical protein